MRGLTALSVVAAMTVYGDLLAEDDVQAFVDSINKQQSLWTAKKRDITHLKNQLLQQQGLDTHEHIPADLSAHVTEVRECTTPVPDEYDPSQQFPECNIRRVKHQYHCGSCWAVSSAGVMQDRLCIHSQGRIKVNISAGYLVGCCDSCSPTTCGPGSSLLAFVYMMRHGAVTGGDYRSNDGCYPYPIGPYTDTPAKGFACPYSCPNVYYDKSLESDKYYVAQIRAVTTGDVEALKQELFRNGPIVISILVYEDFMYYSGDDNLLNLATSVANFGLCNMHV